jgi:ribosomal protein S12 methylthiotransferase accessory factor
MAMSDSTSTYINPFQETFAYRMSEEQGKGLNDLLSMYSPHGLFRKVVTYFGHSGGMPIHVGHSEYYDFDYMLRRILGLSSLDTGLTRTLFAGGKGYDIPNMAISSLSEGVERVLGSLCFFGLMEKIAFGSYRTLTERGYNCLGPDDIPLFADEQYEAGDILYERFTKDSFLGWIEGKRLISGENVWVPGQLVALFYVLRGDENLIGYSTSGGLACHVNDKEALFHGITELIERDAVNIRWNCKIAPEVIELDRAPTEKSLTRLLEAAEGLPGKFRFYLHTIDIPEVPVVTVMENAPWLNRWAYYAGGGVNLDIDLAMLQALSEYGQAERDLRLALAAPDRAFAYAVKRIFDIGEDASARDIDIFFKIVAYYGYPKTFKKMEWFVKGDKHVLLSSLPKQGASSTKERFDCLVEILKKHGIDPIVFDFTPPQMRQAKLMKVFIPGLAPPYLHSKPLLGHPRYYETPHKLGLAPASLRFSDLVPDPLPYP